METTYHKVTFWAALKANVALAGFAVVLCLVGVCLMPTIGSKTDLGSKVVIYGCLLAGVGCAAAIALKAGALPEEVVVAPDALKWRTDSQEHQVVWEKVKELWRDEKLINGMPDFKMRLVWDDNLEMTLDHNLSDYELLVAGIEARTAMPLLGRARETLAAGSKALFGNVTLTPEAIAVETDLLAGDVFAQEYRWEEIKSIDVQRGMLMVYPVKHPHRHCEFVPVALSRIPNFRVALELISELQRTS